MNTAGSDGSMALQERVRASIERLTEEFRGNFSEETIVRTAYESLASMEDARVEEYVPVLVYRFTRDRLRAQAGGLAAARR